MVDDIKSTRTYLYIISAKYNKNAQKTKKSISNLERKKEGKFISGGQAKEARQLHIHRNQSALDFLKLYYDKTMKRYGIGIRK